MPQQQKQQHQHQPKQQQQSNNAADIEDLRSKLLKQLTANKARNRAAEIALAAAQAEVQESRELTAASETQFNAYNNLFPPSGSQKGGKGKAAAPVAVAAPTGKTNGSGPVKANKPASGGKAGRVVISRPAKKAAGSGSLTVPERVAALMGTSTWTAGELQEALANAGESFKSNNLRSYLSTTLNSSMMNVTGPDGGDLKFNDGKLVKVHVFHSVERGQYRVATDEDMQAEVKKLLGVSEVIISGASPGDKVFAEQGIDVRPAVVQHTH